jgi:hypothetical protein
MRWADYNMLISANGVTLVMPPSAIQDGKIVCGTCFYPPSGSGH